MIGYRLLQSFLQLVVSIFFRNIEVVGKENIPTEGGIIFAGNHPNSLMDPLLLITQSERVIRCVAKDALFQSRFLRFFLDTLGAVPIKRKKDHKGKAGSLDNSSAFEALHKVLAEGGCTGIFPEGLSTISSELSEIKTGAARIALGTRGEDGQPVKLSIVPVGLTYLRQDRVRSQVLVHFGEPIEIEQTWRDRYEEAPKEAVKGLTEELALRLRSLTINAPDWDTLKFLHAARRLYRPKGARLSLSEYAELTRRFAEGYERSRDEAEVVALRANIEEYHRRLEQLRLRDYDLQREIGMWGITMRLLNRIIYLLILLPLALPGALIHSPLIMAAVVAGDGMTPRKNVRSTTKLIVSILMVPFLYFAITFLVWWASNIWIAMLAIATLPLTGYATLRVFEQKFAVGKSLRGLLRLMRFRSELSQLKALRASLVAALDKAVDTYHDPSIPRIFPKESPS